MLLKKKSNTATGNRTVELAFTGDYGNEGTNGCTKEALRSIIYHHLLPDIVQFSKYLSLFVQI